MIRIVPTRFDKKEFLTREECAEFLRAQGMRVSTRHLANLASNGNLKKGPPFYKTQWSLVYYDRLQVIKWVQETTQYVA